MFEVNRLAEGHSGLKAMGCPKRICDQSFD